jgi:hypothetical protein
MATSLLTSPEVPPLLSLNITNTDISKKTLFLVCFSQIIANFAIFSRLIAERG